MAVFLIDTETTGLSPDAGDRLVEFGAVKLERGPSGGWRRPDANANLLLRFNPAPKPMPLEAFRVHGLSAAFLSAFPSFAAQAGALVEYLDLANADQHTYAAHNAEFDFAFLKAEFRRIGAERILSPVRPHDTLATARLLYKDGRHTLDALAKRLGVDTSRRTLHGALVDADILADVFMGMEIEQRRLTEFGLARTENQNAPAAIAARRSIRALVTDDDAARRHREGVSALKESLWARYENEAPRPADGLTPA